MALKTCSEYTAWMAGPAAAVYFASPCGVCEAMWPRVEALFSRHFPKVPLEVVDAAASPDVAAQAGVFTVPVLVVQFGGREFLRRERNFSLVDVEQALDRVYSLWQGGEAQE